MGKNFNEKIVNVLQEVYTAEIGAIGIYMDQHSKCADAGINKLAAKLEEDAKEEMKHAEALAHRILFLGASVKYAKHEVPREAEEEIAEMIKMDIAIERVAIKRLNEGIKTCFNEGDNGTRILLEKILVDEERHLDEYETMLSNIEKYGNQYIVSHLI